MLLGWGPGGQERPLSLHPAQDVMAGLPAYDDMQARSWTGITSPSCGLASGLRLLQVAALCGCPGSGLHEA